MKRIILIICLLSFWYGYSQNCKESEGKIPVGNKCNPHLIELPKLKYKSGKAKFVFEGILDDMHKVQIYEGEYKERYEVTGIDINSFNGGIGFHLENNSDLSFSFPVNPKTFNDQYWIDNNIYERMQTEKLKISVHTTVYRNTKNDSRTIIIDSVKLRE